jgi:DNA polymerase-4
MSNCEIMRPDDQPFLLYPFPEAILHIDADAFFTSVEQAMTPSLKGRAVVTGKERGIIACASYEAKAVGVKRGLSLREAKKLCPSLVVLPSDYETYSLYSKRMFSIMRRYTPMVEESSVDEAFADIGGMRRVFHMSYEQIAERMRQEIREELDITVSIGLSVTKSLAKLASDINKPNGQATVEGTCIHHFLRKIPLDDVWGVGGNGVKLLHKYNVKTAYDFACRKQEWISSLLGKPGREIWSELRGHSIYPVSTEEPSSYITVSKTKTFSAPSRDMNYVYARLVRNVESAFIKLRRHKLKAGMVGMLLRHNDYREEGYEAKLNRATSSTQEVMPLVRHLFDMTFRDGSEYRSAMVYLSKLEDEGSDQLDMFEDRLRIDKLTKASAAIDALNRQYGKHSVALGVSLFLHNATKTDKDDPPARRTRLLAGETSRQRLQIPMMIIDV